MGSYTSLSLEGYSVYSTKSYAAPIVMTAFRESDRYCRLVRIGPNGEREVLSSQVELTYDGEADPVDNEDEQIEVGYAAPASVVCDRLEVMGFSLAAARAEFDAGIATELEKYRSWSAGTSTWSAQIEVLASLTFETWLEAFRDLMSRSIHEYDRRPWKQGEEPPEITPLQQYMLTDYLDHWYGYPLVDFRFFLRAALETCEPSTSVEQDLTEVTSAGYYDYDDKVADDARSLLLSDFPANAPIVVLTEGISDRRILEASLRLLQPHIADYYSFMEFEASGAPGGTGSLLATVKAFAGAGIANRTIALFDNDTAGNNALRTLERVDLPANIRALTLPPIPMASQYPTIGPSGTAAMDVNGLAGSIELYFGRDVLEGDGGVLTPVQWRGYDAGLRRYQGEVLNKAGLQQRFEAKLQLATDQPEEAAGLDWSGMHAILNALRTAFVGHSSSGKGAA